MPRTRPPYSPEFRRQMVDLVRAGRNPDDLAREFEPSGHSIRAWVAQADRNEGRREEAAPGLTAFERDELTRLRRENKQLRLERDILSKAAAWFARETGTLAESQDQTNASSDDLGRECGPDGGPISPSARRCRSCSAASERCWAGAALLL